MTRSRTIPADPELDWSVHAHPLHWPISTKAFLAEAVLRVGKALCDPWYNEEPAALAAPLSPEIPAVDDAFNGGKPVPAIHAQHRAAVLGQLSFSKYWESLGRNDYWVDPADDEPISEEHWEEVTVDISFREQTRKHANRAIVHVAKFIAEHAITGTLRTYIRAIPGGSYEELPSRLWAIDDPRPRIASCSLNIEDAMNPSATPTHLIFVDPDDLEKALDDRRFVTRINLIPELEGTKGRPDYYIASTLEVTAWLKNLMQQSESQNWTRGRFRRDAEEKFGNRAGGVVFDRAWADATLIYTRFSRKGVRPKG